MATAKDYIPKKDESFDAWQANFMTVTATLLVPMGLIPADLLPLQAEQTAWANAYAVGSIGVKGNRTPTQVKNKDLARADYEKDLRTFVANHINKNVNLTDGNRVSLGVTVPSPRTSATVPTSAPINAVTKNNLHLVIGLDVRDENTPMHHTKPVGVIFSQVFGIVVPLGAAAPGVSDFAFLGNFTKFNAKLTFVEANTGQVLYFRLRWVNSIMETGTWSPVYSVMIM